MVTETSQLKDWFRPEELEKLIVGTQVRDSLWAHRYVTHCGHTGT